VSARPAPRRRALLLGGVLLSAGVAIGSRLLRRPAPPTSAATLPLQITPRGRWGAQAPRHVAPGEFGFYDANVNRSGWRQYDEPLDQILRTIVVHHSALPLSEGPREIQRMHFEGQRRADIAYHFLIDDAGEIFEGRDIRVRGAHVGGYNTGSVGICLLGNFETSAPSDAQRASLFALCRALKDAYGCTHLAGHNDFPNQATRCPGANLSPLRPELAQALDLAFGSGGYRGG
jgi:hypothetical protein